MNEGGFVIFTREEGGIMEVWWARPDEYERWKSRGYLEDFGPTLSRRRFKPRFMAYAKMVANHDFVLGRAR